MDFYQVKGGNNFSGKIKCGGAKNLSSKAIFATLLSDEVSILDNIPVIGDVEVAQSLLSSIGTKFDFKKNKLTIEPKFDNFIIEPKDNVIYGRMPILLLAVLIHRNDCVEVPIMDGCKLGSRSINFHSDILKTFGMSIEKSNNKYIVKRNHKISGQKIHLEFPSVGATEFAVFLSVLADGISYLSNIATEPEIKSLILMLQQMGAKIQWINQNTLLIEGVSKLSGVNFKIMNDRIEVASWAVLAACSNSVIEVEGVDLQHNSTFLGVFQRMGGGLEVTSNGVKFFKKEKQLHNIKLECGPYPAFSTDYQPMITLMMSQSSGISSIHETLFEDRLSHLKTLEKFGIKSSLIRDCIGNNCKFANKNYYHSALICGETELTAPESIIQAENLRSGITYIIAACISKGTSRIGNISLITRGYENILERLKLLNVDINLIEQ